LAARDAYFLSFRFASAGAEADAAGAADFGFGVQKSGSTDVNSLPR